MRKSDLKDRIAVGENVVLRTIDSGGPAGDRLTIAQAISEEFLAPGDGQYLRRGILVEGVSEDAPLKDAIAFVVADIDGRGSGVRVDDLLDPPALEKRLVYRSKGVLIRARALRDIVPLRNSGGLIERVKADRVAQTSELEALLPNIRGIR